MTAALIFIAGGGLILLAGLRNRSITEVLQGITSLNLPVAAGAQSGSASATGAKLPAGAVRSRGHDYGHFTATAYGPPWGGIQGGGTTATGVDLHSSPHIFGVAVDPSVIPLGTMLIISPNPFNTRAAFKAFDTGGAIKGNRIDFYDWRGRAKQSGWGVRSVHVWKAA